MRTGSCAASRVAMGGVREAVDRNSDRRLVRLSFRVALALGLLAAASQAESQIYQAVGLDSAGQLSITQTSGTVFDAPVLPDQVSASQPRISEDHRTVAWLANYADPPVPSGGDVIAGRLVLYRAGRVLRTYATDQVFWSWHFVHGSRDVAFCTGPTHGGADTCELHRVETGALLAKWNAHATGNPPHWVDGLDR